LALNEPVHLRFPSRHLPWVIIARYDNRDFAMTWKRTGALDSQLDGIYFGMTNGAVIQRCFISGDTLKYVPGNSLRHSEQTFQALAADIEQIAVKKLEADSTQELTIITRGDF
jgi:hypothetical protein